MIGEIHMKRLKIYLDTSVISHLQADDVPDKMMATLALWTDMQIGFYTVVISELVLDELENCHEPKKTSMFEKLSLINFNNVEITSEIRVLANKYVDEGIFPTKYLDDALHVACATVNDCNAIISWNFKHMVKLKTILSVNGINKYMGYGEIEILTPEAVIGEDD